MSTEVQQQNEDYDDQDETCSQQDDDQQDQQQYDDDGNQYNDNGEGNDGDGDGDGDGDDDDEDGDGNNEADDDGPSYVRLRGLPWSATHQEILDFLKNVEVIGGSKGIHLVTSRLHGKNTGEAFVHLASPSDIEEAHKLNKNLMGHRYIEVFNATSKEAQLAIKKTGPGQSYVVKLRGLPYACTEQQIEEFFKGLEIKPDREGILFIMDRRGRATGEAFVQFESHEDTEQALGRNREKIGHRYIEIFRSSLAELRRASTGNGRPGPYDLKDRGSNRGGNFGGSGGGGGGFGGGRNMRGGGDWNNGGFGVGANNTLGFNSLSGFSNSGNFGNGGGGGGFGGNSGNFGNNGNFGNFGNNGGGFGGNNRFNGPNNGGGNFSSDFGDFGNFGNNRNNFNNSSDFSDDNNFGNRGNNNGGNFGNLGNFGNFGNAGGGGGGGSMGGGGGGFNSNMSNNGGGGNFGPIGGGRNDNEYFSVHMRGLPYSSYENDIFKFFDPIRPANVRVNFNKKGLHGGTADVYFDTYEDAQLAMKRHKEQIGNRYIELFFDGKVRAGGNNSNSNNNMSNNTFSRRI